MASPWWDYFRLFTYAFTSDPLSRRKQRDSTGAGISQDGAIPDIRAGGDGTFGEGRGSIRLRDTNDFVDLSTVTNRVHRYKEYERLRNMPEIEMAMTVFADETCLAGETLVATPHGYKAIKDLCKEKERFLIYCYDFDKKDYTLGWAHSARLTKTAPTVKITFDNGNYVICTLDHRILMRNSEWQRAEDIEIGDELMPFYRIAANQMLTKLKTNQYPRIYTHHKGWINERQLIDEWSSGKENPDVQDVNKYCRLIAGGMNIRQIKKITGNDFKTIIARLEKAGYSNSELKWLGHKKDRRRVVGIQPWEPTEVYDLTVERHHNFCTDWGVVHNCQKDENGRVFQVFCENESVKEELEYLLFHRTMLNMDQKRMWDMAKRLFIMGDFFWEIVIDMDDPKQGVLNLVPLPAASMYRIETTKGKLVEFQQSKEGPDYQSLSRVEVAQATDADLQTATAIRFAPDQIIHTRIGDDRKTFYPYGVSLIEAARGPAHQLRLMEDSMIVYRLCLIGETRVRTSNGWKYIKDVRRGDAVHVFNRELMCSQMALINNQFLTGTKRVYRVKSKHVSLTGTDTHPVLVKRVNGSIEYVAISDLVPKQDMFINVHELSEVETRFPCMSDEIWAKLSPTQLFQFKNNNYENRSMLMMECEFLTKIPANRIKQFLYTSGKSLEYNAAYVICDKFKLDYNDLIKGKKGEIRPERIKLPEFVDENFAKLFGFMIGDGSVGDYKLCFASSPDQFLNSQYASLLKKYFGKVTFCPEKRSRKTPGLGAYSVSSKSACDIFIKMGYVRGAKNKRIPHWVFTSPLSIRQAFIQGLADADACIKNLPTGLWTAEFEMCNKSLIEDIKELWNSTGFSSGHIRHRKRKGGHEIEPGRKMKATEAWSVYISKKPLNVYEAIQSIECVGEEDVYDIEVDHPEHNFIANGVPVHNSRAPERRVFYIDTFSLPPYKAEAFIERMKDQFKKKKVGSGKSGLMGASAVEERWHAPAADEDFWIPVRPNSNTRVETLPGACLALDTKIPLLDGRTLTLSEIIEEFNNVNNGKELWSHSCNPQTGQSVPGLITWAGITRKNTQVVKITLGNDTSVICTPDHKFPVQGKKGKIEAQKLEVGDSLIPFNHEIKLHHQVVSVELLDEKIDTGTLTIDGSETYHNYHTFAISGCDIYTYNSNLGEVDDTIYFRNKLFTALNFPKNYFNNEDVQSTRITLSAQDVKFARMIERLQAHVQDAFWEICDRHLRLRGFPEELYDDLEVKMTPPSDWRELTRAEVVSGRIQNAGALKGSQLMSDFDILTKWMKYSEEDALKMLARLKIQKLEELKLQIIAQNPTLLGVGLPGSDETEIGSQPGGPNPMLGGENEEPMGGAPTDPNAPPTDGNQPQILGGGKAGSGMVLADPSEEDILRFNLDVHDFASEMDDEEIEEF